MTIHRNIAIQLPNFDFNKQDQLFLHKFVSSHYAPDLAKAATLVRETMEQVQMHPRLHVAADFAYNATGIGEQYVAHFRSDVQETALLHVGIQQAVQDDEEGTVYLSKVEAIEVFQRFVEQYRGMALVSHDGVDTLEFVSLAYLVGVILRLVDDRVCKIACNIDHDETEPSVQMSFDYGNPQGLIAIALYAR